MVLIFLQIIMPRTYQRKTTRQNWSENSMKKALDAVKNGLPFKTASKQFSVPVMTLKRRAKGKNKFAVDAVKALGSKKTVFTPEQERELVEHIKDMESRMYGLTKQDVLSLAYQLAEKNKIPHPFSAERGKAGVDWLKGFRKRNPDIALRSPESTSAARARAFNKPVVNKFFSIWKDTQEKQPIPPHRIFNVDETSLCTVPTKNTKVFAQSGRKQVARVTSAERGDTTTAVICCSAAGNFIPPMFIFRRLRMKLELMDGAPPGSAYACNASGWMKLEVFDQWFDHFLAHVKPSEDDPAVLFLDGHLSHTKNLSVVLKARENHVKIICLPPHCTHKLQPLDVGVMYPLSVYHNQELEKWMNNHPGRVVSVFQITKVFTGAYLKAAVPLNAIKGFEKCGIYPLNQDVFTDVDFVAAEATEIEANVEDENSSDSVSVLDNKPSQLVLTRTVDTPQDSLNLNPGPSSQDDTHTNKDEILVRSDREIATTECIGLDSTPELSSRESTHSENDERHIPDIPPSEQLNNSPIKSPQILENQTVELISNLIAPTSCTALAQDINTVATPTLVTQDVDSTTFDQPSTSFGVYSARDLRPLPKIQGKRNNNVRKRKIDTSILTSTPYKNYLEEEMQKKIEKEAKQKSREDKSVKIISEKRTKGKGVGKGQKTKQANKKREDKKNNTKKQRIKRARKSYESESSDDAECMFCTEAYSKDAMGEGWVLCVKCHKWGHEACAGLDSDDEKDFVCDFCVDSVGQTKKQLDF